MKVKVIDLLVKIAYSEYDIPKIISYRNKLYRYNEDVKDYELDNERGWLMDISRDAGNEFLNDEVEIIDISKKLDKKLEKIKYYDDSINWVIDNAGQLRDIDKIIIDKINEIIDYINYINKEF